MKWYVEVIKRHSFAIPDQMCLHNDSEHGFPRDIKESSAEVLYRLLSRPTLFFATPTLCVATIMVLDMKSLKI